MTSLRRHRLSDSLFFLPSTFLFFALSFPGVLLRWGTSQLRASSARRTKSPPTCRRKWSGSHDHRYTLMLGCLCVGVLTLCPSLWTREEMERRFSKSKPTWPCWTRTSKWLRCTTWSRWMALGSRAHHVFTLLTLSADCDLNKWSLFERSV